MGVFPRTTRWYGFVLGALLVLGGIGAKRAEAQEPAASSEVVCGVGGTCGMEASDAVTVAVPSEATAPTTLLFFWGTGCPHCEEAKPFVDELAHEFPELRIEAIEVRRDPKGRRRFIDTMGRFGAGAVGVPTFVMGNDYVVGFSKATTGPKLRALVASAVASQRDPAGASVPPPPARNLVTVPLLGDVDPGSVSLPGLTLAMGLADGVNPCAIWVLVVLLGILLHVETIRRMLLYAFTFVAMSGVVYFMFMVAWATLFELAGLSREVTRGLGGVLFAMGLINLKDVFWFKKGVSLVIPDKVKPGLFRRMRAIAGAASTSAALLGIAILAFVVNLVELGCTLGLPAIYTRILSLRGLAPASRVAYLVLYNMAYVVPLLVVVGVFIALKRRLIMTEQVARALKGLSGALLTLFGALFLFAPQTLSAP